MVDVVHLEGDRVVLVPLDKDLHLENFVRWLNDPEVTKYTGHVVPLTRIEEEEFFERVTKSANDIVWAVHDETNMHIGVCGLHRIDWQMRMAVSGTIIGDTGVWSRGYGTDVMRTRTKWAFEELGLHRIESECDAENIASAKCLERAGYRQIGVARKRRWRGGKWRDSILWEIIDEDYFADSGE
jgi:RimJ/RimL family protein N-acetyltransferase